MKPTLDEEIRKIALAAVVLAKKREGLEVFESAIRAGIEAWKRQEPSAAIIAASITAMETGITSAMGLPYDAACRRVSTIAGNYGGGGMTPDSDPPNK